MQGRFRASFRCAAMRVQHPSCRLARLSQLPSYALTRGGLPSPLSSVAHAAWCPSSLQAALFVAYTFMVSVSWGAWTIGKQVEGLKLEVHEMSLDVVARQQSDRMLSAQLDQLSAQMRQQGAQLDRLSAQMQQQSAQLDQLSGQMRQQGVQLDQLSAQTQQLLLLDEQGS